MKENLNFFAQQPAAAKAEQEKKKIKDRALLSEGIPAMARELVDTATGNEELEELQEKMAEDDAVTWVDFDGGDFDELAENGFKQDGIESYLISPISERDWFSDHYFSCTAVIGMGRDAKTGQELSFLSHQDPNYFVDGGPQKAEKFKRALARTLKELKARSEEGSVDVSLLGGNFSAEAEEGDYKHHQYLQSIAKLREIVQESLEFDPQVLAGPNNNLGSETAITVETAKRKVWLERSRQAPEFDQPFMANQLEEQAKKWRQ